MQNVPKFTSFKSVKLQSGERPLVQCSKPPSLDTSSRPLPLRRTCEQDHDPLVLPKSLALPLDHERQDDRWTSDRWGDPDNTRYSTNDRQKVPVYRATHDYGALGDRSQNSSKHRNARPLLEKSPFVAASQNVGLSDTARNFIDPQEHLRDYISLHAGQKRKRGSRPKILGVIGQTDLTTTPQPDRRKRTASVSSNSESLSEPGGAFEKVVDDQGGCRKRHDELRAAIRNHSQHAQPWLDLVAFQDEWVRSGLGSDGNVSSRKLASTALELKLAVLAEALKNIPKHGTERGRLLMCSMDVGSKVWSTNEIAEKWQTITNEESMTSDLRMRYLNFLQSVDFSLEGCRDAFRDSLKACLKYPDQRVSATLNAEESSAIVHLFSRLTSMLFGSGYQEQAVALWQALLELITALNPLTPNKTSKEPLRDLYHFWDDEWPRIGDPSVDSSLGTRSLSSSQEFAMSGTWFVRESTNMQRFQMPGKTANDEIDDPFHVVLSADIEPFMADFLAKLDVQTVVNGFLNFFRRHLSHSIEGSSIERLRGWHDDGFLHGVNVSWVLKLGEGASDNLHVGRAEDILKAEQCGRGPWTSFTNVRDPNNPESTDTTQSIHFVHDVLRDLVQRLPSDEKLAERYLLIDSFTFPATARKTSKALLKQRASEARLYHAHALVELCLGNQQAAETTLETAIKMLNSLKIRGDGDRRDLFRTWIFLAIRRGDLIEASKHTISAALDWCGENNPKGIYLMTLEAFDKAEVTLRQKLSAAMASSSDESCIMLCTELLTCIAYLRPCATALPERPRGPTSPSIDDGVHSFDTILPLLQRSLSSINFQILQQSLALLIRLHISQHRSYTKSIIRDFLRQCCERHPGNPMFLEVLFSLPSGGLDDRIRTAANGPSTEPKSVPAWAVTIHSELMRSEVAGGTPHAVRAIFERAVASDCGKHCGALWSAYLTFELERVERDRARRAAIKQAKNLWWRGWAALPWSKSWGMLAFGVKQWLEGQGSGGDAWLSSDELREVADTMADRGFRFYVDVDEAFSN